MKNKFDILKNWNQNYNIEKILLELKKEMKKNNKLPQPCLLYTSPSPRDGLLSRMPSSA